MKFTVEVEGRPSTARDYDAITAGDAIDQFLQDEPGGDGDPRGRTFLVRGPRLRYRATYGTHRKIVPTG